MSSRRGKVELLMAGLVAAVAVTGGCARPQGLLFPTIDPPRVWPPPPDIPRIRLLGVLSSSNDLNAAESASEAFAAAFRGRRPPIKFSVPHAVAFRQPGLLAVADATGAAVHIINLEQRTQVLITGFNDQRLAVPLGVAWAGSRLYLTDAGRREVIEMDSEGRFVRRFGEDFLRRPVGIAYCATRDQLYVVDGDAHQVRVFSLNGSVARTIGQRGILPGEFNFPTHISASGDQLIVADSGNFRVQLLDLDGECLRTIGKKGDGAGDFALPKGVAFDSEGHIYVVDAQFENIQVFDTAGQLLMAFGQEGNGLGEFSLPAGLAIDGMDRIWVTDAGNRRLQVFSYLRRSS